MSPIQELGKHKEYKDETWNNVTTYLYDMLWLLRDLFYSIEKIANSIIKW